jgi:glucose/arabinose dehydrogenase
MLKHHLWQLGAITLLALSLATCKKHDNCDENGAPATMSVFATGLNNPRGLEFGPDGNLYVAEGGIGGTESTTPEQCEQVPAPVGPYKGSTTGGRISMINKGGVRTTVTDQLPSSVSAMGDVVGVGDIAFIGNTMYAAITGAGCSHGVPSRPNSVIRFGSDNKWTQVANFSRFLKENPVQKPEEDDFEPDGDLYSMISVGDNLYVIEANHGELDWVNPSSGDIKRIVDISASQGHIVPTVVAYRDGNFYVGNLNTFPIVKGSSKVLKISPSGTIQEWATGFTTILGLAFDNSGNLYVLENTASGDQFPTPGKGQITRVHQSGEKEVIITGLNLPTGLTYGPDGNLYVSNVGFGPDAIGGGQVLKVTLNKCGCGHNNYDQKN